MLRRQGAAPWSSPSLGYILCRVSSLLAWAEGCLRPLILRGRGASEGLTITYGSHHKVTVHLTDVFNVISIFKNCAFYSLYSLLYAALCRPHPVRMFDVHKTEEMMYMVMELAHGGMFRHHFLRARLCNAPRYQFCRLQKDGRLSQPAWC